jgi:alpha-D-xyloside xylohydrolase
VLELASASTPSYGPAITPLQLIVSIEGPSTLHVQILDPSAQRWRVPEWIYPPTSPAFNPGVPFFLFSYTSNPFGFAVQRIADGVIVFNSTSDGLSRSGLVYTDQYLEIGTQLPGERRVQHPAPPLSLSLFLSPRATRTR